MAPRTPAGIRSRLGRAGLLELAESPTTMVRTKVAGGVLHADYCSHRPTGATEGMVPLARLLDAETTTADCLLERVGDLYGVSVDGQYAALSWLLLASETARAAERLANTVTPAPGAVTRMLNKAERARADLTDSWRPAASAAADRDRILNELDAAITELSTPPASRDEARCASVAARVHDDLVPRSLRGRVNLDSSPVLIGIAPHRITSARVNDVLHAFAIGRGRQELVTLLAPRFVSDYLNRYYAAGNNWTTVIQTVPVDGLDETQVSTAAQLWEPLADVPLADLATAVTMAGHVLTDRAGLPQAAAS